MDSYFVDTGFWKALVDKSDFLHERADRLWQEIDHDHSVFVLSAMIFSETTTLIKTRAGLGQRIAKAWGERLLVHPSVSLIQMDHRLFNETWKYFIKYGDKGYSFVDCSSFVIMKELKLHRALTFDHHFEQAGFQVLPQ